MKIDEEFKSLLPPLDQREIRILEADIKKNGCRESLIIWGETLVDGHNRYAICTKHDIEFETVEMEFSDRDAVMNWIDNNQLGRRNLNAEQYTATIGRMYNRHKKSTPNPEGVNRTEVRGHSDPQPKTADVIAKEHGVSASTVKRAGNLMESIGKLKDIEPGLEDDFYESKAPTRKQIVAAAKVVGEDPDAAKEILHPTETLRSPRKGKGLEAAAKVIGILKRIPKNDSFRVDGLNQVADWIKTNR